MTTNRTPLARQQTAPLSPQAAALYLQMRQIRCTCPPPPPGSNAPPSPQCGPCEKWWSLHSQLDEALGKRPPWLWPHLPPPTLLRDRDGGLRPRPPAPHMVALESRLKAAAKAARPEKVTNGDAPVRTPSF
jgi:hypothetical protein